MTKNKLARQIQDATLKMINDPPAWEVSLAIQENP